MRAISVLLTLAIVVAAAVSAEPEYAYRRRSDAGAAANEQPNNAAAAAASRQTLASARLARSYGTAASQKPSVVASVAALTRGAFDTVTNGVSTHPATAVAADANADTTATPAQEQPAAVYEPYVYSGNVRSYMQTANTPQSMNRLAADAVAGIGRRGMGYAQAPYYYDAVPIEALMSRDAPGVKNVHTDVYPDVDWLPIPVYPDDPNVPYASLDARVDVVVARTQLYQEGVIMIPSGVPFTLAILSAFGWCFFCWARCCCDTCGGRKATMKYTSEQRNICRALIAVNFAFMVIVFGFGMSANAGVSDSVDAMANAADTSVEYMFSYHTILNQALDVLTDGYGRMSALNDTIYGVLPSASQIGNYTVCLNDIYVTLNFNTLMVARVIYLRNTTQDMGNLHAFATQLRTLNSNISSLPNLGLIESQMRTLNTTMSHLPSGALMSGQIGALNSSIAAYQAQPNITRGILKLQSSLVGFDTTKFSVPVARDEAAIKTLPDFQIMRTDMTGVDGTYDRLLSDLYTTRDNLTTLLMYPNPAELSVMLRDLSFTLKNFSQSFGLIAQIDTMQTIIAGVPDLRPLNNSLKAIRTFQLTAPPQVTVLKGSVSRADRSISSFPNMNTFYNQISVVKVGVDKLRAANITQTMAQLLVLNASLPDLGCILPLFDTLEAINASLVELPAGLNETLALKPGIVSSLANLTNIYKQIRTGYNNLKSLNSTLSNLPDFVNLLNKTAAINGTINNLPNMTSVYYQLIDLETSILQLPDIELYQSQLTQLNNSLNVPTFSSLKTQMTSLQDSVNNFPNLAEFINNTQLMNDSISTTMPLLTSSIQFMRGIDSTQWDANNQGIQPPGLQTALSAALNSLDATIKSRPNATKLLEDLHTINTTIKNMPDLVQTAADTGKLDRSITDFPSISNLQSKTAGLDRSANGQTGLTSIINGGSLTALNASLQALPDLPDAAQKCDNAQNDIDNTDFNGLIHDLENVGTDFDAAARDDSISQLQNFNTFRAGLPDINGLLVQLNNSVNSGTDAQHTLVSSRNSYYYNRNLGYLYANEYDGQRVLFTNVLFFMPMFLALLGVLGCVLQKPCPLMWMSLSSIPMMAVLFAFCAIYMIPAIITNDFCAHRDTMLTNYLKFTPVNLGALETGRDDTKPNRPGLFNTTNAQNLTAADLYFYFAACDDPPTDSLVVQMRNPDLMLTHAGYNFTDSLAGVSGSANNQGFKLRPNVVNQLDGFNNTYNAAGQVLRNLGAAMECSDTNALHLGIAAFYGGVCDQLMTSLAMCTGLLFIAAACSCPGICIGIRAYKRLDPNNFGARVEKDDHENPDGENKMDDGHAIADRDAAKIAALTAARQKESGGHHHHHSSGAAGVASGHSHKPSTQIGSSIGGGGAVAGAPRYTAAQAASQHPGVEMSAYGGGAPQAQGVKPLQFDAAGNLIA